MFSTDSAKIDTEFMPLQNFSSEVTCLNNDHNMTCLLPYGKIYVLKSFQERHPRLLNKYNEYFYVLNIEFSKDNLKNKIQ